MSFPKPSFDALVLNYDIHPESVHDCPYIHRKNPINVNTCAIRMSEALVIADGLIASREAIAALTDKAGNGKAMLLGKFGYRANLCPHGIARGASDLADFLRQQWGKPDFTWAARKETTPPEDVLELTGLVAFIKLADFDGQGHIDLWNQTSAVGHDYWNAQKVYFWKLG
jgi:type VI secretion system (T6SS) effector Tae4 (amidase)